jgi:hypothetical protein
MVSSYHSLQTVQKTITDQNRVCCDYQLSFRAWWNISTIICIFPMDSFMWHFSKPLHRARSLLQILKGSDNVEKITD